MTKFYERRIFCTNCNIHSDLQIEKGLVADAARVVMLAVDEVNKASMYNYKGKLKRKDFSEKTKKATLIKQNHKCNICKEKLDDELFDFDHIDGNRSNNSMENCQALCPNCHQKKTRKRKKQN